MVDLGVVPGIAGIVTGGASIVYAHAQVTAARRQAQQAAHMTVLEANQHLFERIHNARERLGRSEALLEDIRSKVPELAQAFDAAGSFQDYILVREVTELFQDGFFMRKAGIVTDAYWRDLVGNLRLWARLTAFRHVFDFAASRDLLHPEFVAFAREVLDGKSPRDLLVPPSTRP